MDIKDLIKVDPAVPPGTVWVVPPPRVIEMRSREVNGAIETTVLLTQPLPVVIRNLAD